MGKTYFNLVDQLNFNGEAIKIKGNAKQELNKTVTKEEKIWIPGNYNSTYQSMLASQPQVYKAESMNGISTEVYLSVINSSPQVGKINIEMNDNGKCVVGFSTSLNKVTTGAPNKKAKEKNNYEEIIVSGLQAEGRFIYQFIEAALHDINVRIKKGTKPDHITWLVYYSELLYKIGSNDNQHFKETAKNLGIKIQLIKKNDELINYINYKSIYGKSEGRKKNKISYMSVFGHGQTPLYTGGAENQLSFGYEMNKYSKTGENLESILNFKQSDIDRLLSEAFDNGNMETYFYTCNAGTADKNGLRFAQLWADKTIGISHAFQNARSNYIFINSTMDEINAAFNLPGGMPDPAVSDYINGLKEISKEKAEKIARYITGEKGAETVGEIFDTSEEWKEKQSRKIDRERLDKAGKKYGYADKGSLQYPMVNNRGDDWKIIVGTWGEPRGFLTYTYTVTGIMDICSSKI